MLIYIVYNITESATGGGNQFIKNLKRKLAIQNMITDRPNLADVILYNGHQYETQVRKLKRDYPNKIFIHRMDGLQKLYNHKEDTRQDKALNINSLADGTVFQSNWARDNFKLFGFDTKRKNTVIYNAADPDIFKKTESTKRNKFRILTTSWSPHIKKGFTVYKYLDENLNFDVFEYYFIGNSPIKFKNIISISPLNTKEIAEFMNNCDIFVSATENDACSNSIIEALTMGLNTFVLRSGGNTELVTNPTRVFHSPADLLYKLQNWTSNRTSVEINPPLLDNVVKQYMEFAHSCIK